MPIHVEGYGVRRPGETYLPGSEFDPAEKFANAGDPEAAGKVEEAKQPAPEPFLEDAEGSEVVTDSGQPEVEDEGVKENPEEDTPESETDDKPRFVEEQRPNLSSEIKITKVD